MRVFETLKYCCVVSLALYSITFGATYTWDGDGGNTNWTNPNNWTVATTGYPDDSSDNAVVADTTPSSTCTFDDTTNRTIKDLTVTGSSPTKMKVHVSGATLTVEDLILNDYAELDVDKNLTVGSGQTTSLLGEVWVDIATATELVTRQILAAGNQIILHLTTSGTGKLKTESITIDANAANAHRALKIEGGTVTLKSGSTILVKSDLDTDNQRGKLWITSGTNMSWECAGFINLIGGTMFARRCEIDLDADFETTSPLLNVATTVQGHVDVDIAADKTFRVSELKLIGGNTVLRVTAGVDAQLESSTPEDCETP